MNILGVRYGHDASAALIIDGEIIADVSEERFTRIKNDTSFPINAIDYCLLAGNISSEELDCVAIPTRAIQPAFFVFFSIPEDVVPNKKRPELKDLPVLPMYFRPFNLSKKCKIHLVEHHLAHAASVCFTSGLYDERALVATMDGAGDGVSVALWRFEKNRITNLAKYGRDASLGYFYSNATEALGWRHGSDEWKLMGLAPYGVSHNEILRGFYPEYEDGCLVKKYQYGEFGRWNDHGANHYHGDDSCKLSKFVEKLGRENFSAEVQRVVEEQAKQIILPWLKKENTRNLLCAGGFFLNVKFNQLLWYTGALDVHWIYPNCGDSGLSIGAALHFYYSNNPEKKHKRLEHLYLGPEFSNEQVELILKERNIKYKYIKYPAQEAARYLFKNCVVGWFQGRMESGPRALGNRSILMSPLRAENKDLINDKIKYRESFRPFCPSMLYEKRQKYLVNERDEFFMVTSFKVNLKKKHRIPAVIHVDDTVRPQMVRKETNFIYHELIKSFGDLSGEYVVLNTSFNVKGEPIVLGPRDAIKCFFDTGMDVLIINNYLIKKPAC